MGLIPVSPAATITVATITRGRPQVLMRAIESVCSQSVGTGVDHLIIVDDCPRTVAALEALPPGPWRWVLAERERGERSGTGRVARLRNAAVHLSDAGWLAFLDDDNLWREDHLATLFSCAHGSARRAVHCHRDLRLPDALPYIEPYFPWASSRDDARAAYLRAVAAGVMRPGSPVLRTGVSAALPAEFRFVDMGEWLAARELFLEVPLTEEFTPEQELVVGEDDLWMDALLERGEPVGCTGQATLRYFLGGMTTAGNAWLSPGGRASGPPEARW